MNQCDTQYLSLVKDVLENGIEVPTRGTIDGKNILAKRVIGRQARFRLDGGFPILTTKKVSFNNIVHELVWFLSASSNTQYLRENNVKIWDAWSDADGELGFGTYGTLWREFPFHTYGDEFCDHYDHKYSNESSKRIVDPSISHFAYESDIVGQVDQIRRLLLDIEKVKKDPTASCGRRLIVTAWHPYYTDKVKLPPCHCLFQFDVCGAKLSCHLYQRSADVLLGVPYNISSYALFTCVIAKLTGLIPYEFIHTFHNLHAYSNHYEQLEEQLTRPHYPAPTLEIVGDFTIDSFKRENVKLVGYKHSGVLKGQVAV